MTADSYATAIRAITTEDAANALRRAGAEIWTQNPQDDDAVVVTFGLIKRLLTAPAPAPAISGEERSES
jgi:hypothetical protein